MEIICDEKITPEEFLSVSLRPRRINFDNATKWIMERPIGWRDIDGFFQMVETLHCACTYEAMENPIRA